ncbi:hypothetical protein G7069_09540 [Lysobacter sp. HDW10]|uniref:HNH endonuclease n=1 Tax=Lysobacter sp. HDW10 TaxID=2714936 RepID=UPI00140D9CFC|nr:hypothetical protein [Lysobacter sp. HDW10]QIK81816.1 hypothetical protein G7069_09540 [Lysobacter sp. HDW10]
MKKIPAPSAKLKDVFDKCVSSIGNHGRRKRFEAINSYLSQAEKLYDERAEKSELYLFEESSAVGDVTGDELSKLYSQTFVRVGGPTRDIYELLRKAPGNICPLCNQRVVSTLDHYLPKGRHPSFAVTPINLVPACKDCNVDSSQKRPNDAGEQTLHPYFDDVDDQKWLVAEVVPDSPPGILFYVRGIPTWSSVKNSIVSSHFKAYRLSDLYAAHAGSELVNIYIDMDDARLLSKPLEIQSHLVLQAKKRRLVFNNSWQAALFEALSESAWFCEGGILEVRKSLLFPANYLQTYE